LYKGKEQKKGCAKNNAEINWNTEYKSKAYKHTIKMIAKITKYDILSKSNGTLFQQK